jgi:hypothetical protein
LDLTTGVFPVTKVDLEVDVVPVDWKPISELDQKVMNHYEFLEGIWNVANMTQMVLLKITRMHLLA